MLAQGKNIYILMKMQLVYVLIWSPYSTYNNLRKKCFLWQLIWADMKTYK